MAIVRIPCDTGGFVAHARLGRCYFGDIGRANHGTIQVHLPNIGSGKVSDSTDCLFDLAIAHQNCIGGRKIGHA